MKTERYVMIEIHAFGEGMRKLFEGVADVFASMGVTDNAALEKARSRWDAKQAQVEDEEPDKVDTTEENHPSAVNAEPNDQPGEEPKESETNQPVEAAEEIPTVPEKSSEAVTGEKETEPEEPKKKAGKKKEKSTVSLDDITKIIVQKIKRDRTNNEKIEQLVKSYGAARVSELPENQYEAFLTDLAAI